MAGFLLKERKKERKKAQRRKKKEGRREKRDIERVKDINIKY